MPNAGELKIMIVAAALEKLSDEKKTIVEREATHNLDRLHANEDSLEKRLTLFLGIAVSLVSVLLGYAFVGSGNVTAQPILINLKNAAFIAALGIFCSAWVMVKALFPTSAYWCKGCSPFQILQVQELVTCSDRAFRNSIIEAMQERCENIDARNRYLAVKLKCGLKIMAVTPAIALAGSYLISLLALYCF